MQDEKKVTYKIKAYYEKDHPLWGGLEQTLESTEFTGKSVVPNSVKVLREQLTSNGAKINKITLITLTVTIKEEEIK